MASTRAARTPARKAALAWSLGAALVLAIPAIAVLAAVTGGDAPEEGEPPKRPADAPPAAAVASADSVPQEASAQRRERSRDRERSDRAARGRTAGTLPKSVTLVVRGTATPMQTRGETVADLLRIAGLDLSEDDRVNHEPGTALSGGMRVVVEIVDVETEVDVETLSHETVRKETSQRQRGKEAVVQEGKDGKRETTIERVFVDGVLESVTDVGEEVTDPVNRVIEVGTAPPPEPKPKPKPKQSSSGGGDGVWDRLAECEANGNWSMNSGNGFYGGLQFMKGTWDSVGGTEFAEYPHQASRQQQITAGKRLQQRSGWGQWPHCSKVLGLR